MDVPSDPQLPTGDHAGRPPLPPRGDGRPAELADLVATMRQIDRLTALAVQQAAQLDGRRAAAEEALPVDTALGLHAGWTRTDVRMLQTTGDLLTRMPAAAAMFRDGTLSWGHVRVLVCGARRFDRDRLALLDQHLGSHADELAAMDPERREWALQDAIDEHTPTTTLAAREDRAVEQDRLVLLPRLDGSGTGVFDLHAEAFDTVASRLDAEADTPQAAPAPTTDDAEAAPELEPVPRSRQLADALVRLCSRHDGGEHDPIGATRSIVVVDVDRLSDRFAGELRTAVASRPPRIVRRAIDRITCDTALEVVLRHGNDLVAATRYGSDISAATRRAVAVRDGGCRFPGCRAPVSWCDVHHVVERARGGHHGLDNLVLLCRRHHTSVHRRGWRQHLSADGRYRLSRHGRSWTTLPRQQQRLRPPDLATSAARDGPSRAGPSEAGPTHRPTDRDDDLPF